MFMSCDDVFFFFKQKTAYEMRISDWSSDVCSSDLDGGRSRAARGEAREAGGSCRLSQFERGALRLAVARQQPVGGLARGAGGAEARAVVLAQDGEPAAEVIGVADGGDDDERGASSEARRVGEECVRPCRFRWEPNH